MLSLHAPLLPLARTELNHGSSMASSNLCTTLRTRSCLICKCKHGAAKYLKTTAWCRLRKFARPATPRRVRCASLPITSKPKLTTRAEPEASHPSKYVVALSLLTKMTSQAKHRRRKALNLNPSSTPRDPPSCGINLERNNAGLEATVSLLSLEQVQLDQSHRGSA